MNKTLCFKKTGPLSQDKVLLKVKYHFHGQP